MAVYTDLSDAELEAFLAAYDLGAPVSFKGIAEGVENSNFVLETAKGRFILTVYERRVREADLPFFLSLMEWLADRGFPSARPIADKSGQRLGRVRDRPAAIISFLPGLSVRRPTPEHCAGAGVGLSGLHQAAEGFPASRPNDLGAASWKRLFKGLEVRAEALRGGLADEVASDLDQLERAWPRQLPSGVVHADWFPDNVFFRSRAFAGAIDFYFAANDLLAYDLAIALNAWCFDDDGGFSTPRARALVDGYERGRPLSAAERAGLPLLAQGAAMRFFLTRLADWGDDRPGALVRPKDPLEFERRLAFHRRAVRAGGGLDGLLAA
ncbi:MAG TPA: homoserine kinase [Caulobacteraceae bacterium]|nr:homoserine kinase [Caulobacteraceae bacterium]